MEEAEEDVEELVSSLKPRLVAPDFDDVPFKVGGGDCGGVGMVAVGGVVGTTWKAGETTAEAIRED